MPRKKIIKDVKYEGYISSGIFTKTPPNPEFELFESFVDEIKKEINSKMDNMILTNDASTASILLHTGDTLKKHIRASKWA